MFTCLAFVLWVFLLLGVLWTSWICFSFSVINFGKFSIHYHFSYFLCPVILSSLLLFQCGTLPESVPQFLENFSFFFSFCFHLAISIDLPSKSLNSFLSYIGSTDKHFGEFFQLFHHVLIKSVSSWFFCVIFITLQLCTQHLVLCILQLLN
jgi:hypothetical protein